MKGSLILLAALSLASAVLVGCGSGDDAAAANTPAPANAATSSLKGGLDSAQSRPTAKQSGDAQLK